jgi:hypothetical protein
MTGLALAAAELYARHNIPTIPIGANKRPAVRGFKIASLTVDKSRAVPTPTRWACPTGG